MDLLIPEGGLLFWMTLVFVIVFLILWKFGFPAIVKMIDERKAYIDESLRKAKEANDKLQNIQKEGEAMLQEARDKQPPSCGRLPLRATLLSRKLRPRPTTRVHASLLRPRLRSIAKSRPPSATFAHRWLSSLCRSQRRFSARNSLLPTSRMR